MKTECWLVVDLGEDGRKAHVESYYMEKWIEIRDQILNFDQNS